MEIVPNTSIYILKSVPLDPTYEHTIYFNSKIEQHTYFQTKVKHTLPTQSSYQRVRRGWLRIGISADALYDCNYLMFNNTPNGSIVDGISGITIVQDKWFYAFIKSVNYVNNVTSEIEYEIDVMQSWMFDYVVNDSFIEREHTGSDLPGQNLVPENLEIGEYMTTAITDMFNFNYRIVVGTTVGPSDWDNPDWTVTLEPVDGAMFNGIYSGVAYVSFATITGVNNFLKVLTEEQKSDSVVSIFMCPSALIQQGNSSFVPSAQSIQTLVNVSAPTPTFWSNYTVRNYKLLTSPFVTFYLTDNKGNSVEMPFEYFNNRTPSFSAWGSMSSNPGIMVFPQNYKGVQGINRDEGITISGFPMCSYNIDAYKAWLAQNSGYIISDLISSGLNTTLQTATGNVGGATNTAIGSVSNLVASIYHHSMMPPQARGNTNGNTLYSMGLNSLFYSIKYIRNEFVYIIDDYFDRFGYAVHRLKKPDIQYRPTWYYIKTIKVNLTGSVPCDDMAKIASCYDNGITFWKYINNLKVGDYGQNNRPITI